MDKNGTPLVPPRQTSFGKGLENLYQLWASSNQVPLSNDYDMRGFYLGSLLGDPSAVTEVNASDKKLHFTDKWKLPNHPAFSNESIYSRSNNDPRWVRNPAPYVDGTWGRLAPRGLLDVEIPQ